MGIAKYATALNYEWVWINWGTEKAAKNEGPEYNEQNKYIPNKYDTVCSIKTNTIVWHQNKKNEIENLQYRTYRGREIYMPCQKYFRKKYLS